MSSRTINTINKRKTVVNKVPLTASPMGVNDSVIVGPVKNLQVPVQSSTKAINSHITDAMKDRLKINIPNYVHTLTTDEVAMNGHISHDVSARNDFSSDEPFSFNHFEVIV